MIEKVDEKNNGGFGYPLLGDGRLIKKIMLKKGIKEKEVTKISNMFEKWGKFLENGKDDNGDYYIVAQFDDAMDYLAFLVFIGKTKVSPVA